MNPELALVMSSPSHKRKKKWKPEANAERLVKSSAIFGHW
jgi:hypothetical protein